MKKLMAAALLVLTVSCFSTAFADDTAGSTGAQQGTTTQQTQQGTTTPQTQQGTTTQTGGTATGN